MRAGLWDKGLNTPRRIDRLRIGMAELLAGTHGQARSHRFLHSGLLVGQIAK